MFSLVNCILLFVSFYPFFGKYHSKVLTFFTSSNFLSYALKCLIIKVHAFVTPTREDHANPRGKLADGEQDGKNDLVIEFASAGMV
jgi:hypothetical protein